MVRKKDLRALHGVLLTGIHVETARQANLIWQYTG